MKKKVKTVAEKKEEKATRERAKKFHGEILDKLEDGNVISNMNRISELQAAQSKYYHFTSKLWKAIRNHVSYSKDCVLCELEGTIISHRGTGASISIKKTRLYAPDYKTRPPTEADHFSLSFEVEYFCEGEERSYDPDTYRRTYYVNPPVALELNFTKRGFDAWIKEMREKRDVEIEKPEREELKRLKKKYE